MECRHQQFVNISCHTHTQPPPLSLLFLNSCYNTDFAVLDICILLPGLEARQNMDVHTLTHTHTWYHCLMLPHILSPFHNHVVTKHFTGHKTMQHIQSQPTSLLQYVNFLVQHYIDHKLRHIGQSDWRSRRTHTYPGLSGLSLAVC